MRKSFNLSKQFKHLLLYVNTEQLFLVQFMPNTAYRFKGSPFGFVLYFESLFLIPSRAAARCQETQGRFCRWKRCFASKSREDGEAPGRKEVKSSCPQQQASLSGCCLRKRKDFSPLRKKGKLVSVNSVFYLQDSELLQKCPSKLTELVSLPIKNHGLLPAPQEVR